MVVSIKKATLTAVAVATATVAVLAVSSPPAFADGGHHGDSVIRTDLMGSTPLTMPNPSPVIAGIKPGGVPWTNGESTARVRESGRVDVRIRGLIVTTTGVNPVLSVVATLVCGDVVGPSTAPFALSTAGDGRTRDHIMVPMDCMNPVVLIQPAANLGVYIASGMGMDDDD